MLNFLKTLKKVGQNRSLLPRHRKRKVKENIVKVMKEDQKDDPQAKNNNNGSEQ
ncbi:MAG TPA: hypothetical protein VKO42_02775 [Patescibacteria group bacterium]|nr:hypothetical protein [Patescibacteria group bacterium]